MIEESICSDDESSLQDDRLNQAWHRLLSKLTPAQQTNLRQLERQWISQREKTCHNTVESDTWANNAFWAQAMYGACYIDQTIRRIIWLEHLR